MKKVCNLPCHSTFKEPAPQMMRGNPVFKNGMRSGLSQREDLLNDHQKNGFGIYSPLYEEGRGGVLWRTVLKNGIRSGLL